MLFSSGGRRLVVLIRRNAAAAGGGINPFQPQAHLQPHGARFSHRYLSTRTAIAPDPNPSHTTAASYLVASCGLSPAAAAAVVSSHGIRIVSTAKADAVLALLRHYGFSDTQIASLIRQSPRLLLIDPDKILRPKLEFFASLGFPVGYLARKSILARSLNKHIIPCFEFLRGILGTDANIRLAVPRNPIALNFNLKKKMCPALQALRRGGLSDEVISKLVLIHIGVLGLAPDRIAGIIEDLEALGLPVSDSRFVYGFRFMSTISREKWLQKVALYRSLGVSEGDLLRAFRTQPSIMLISEESIKKKLRFFLEDLKLDLSYVMQRPVVIGYSLEKCIIPRCVVLSVLMRKGKIDRGTDLLRALLGTSKGFSKQYVLRALGHISVLDSWSKVVIRVAGYILMRFLQEWMKVQCYFFSLLWCFLMN